LPKNSFTLINDDKNNIYLTKIKNIQNQKINSDENVKEYLVKYNNENRNNILRSYDLLLNKKYNVILNQKTIERVKNFFQ
jgi:peptidyl-prolyl cis-trans isomerase D